MAFLDANLLLIADEIGSNDQTTTLAIYKKDFILAHVRGADGV